MNITTFNHEGEKKWKIYHIKKAASLATQKILDNIKGQNDVVKTNIVPIEKFSTYPRYIVSISKLDYKKKIRKKLLINFKTMYSTFYSTYLNKMAYYETDMFNNVSKHWRNN